MTPGGRPLRVCLDARLADGGSGGVQQFIMGLASGLAQLDGDEQYRYLVHGELGVDWLAPFARGPDQFLDVERRVAAPGLRTALSRVPRVGSLAQAAYRAARALGRYRVPRSDGTIEKAGVQVVHLTIPSGFLTDVPSVYQVHDLQHLHFPEYFDRHTFRAREALYRGLCDQARVVAVMSRWVKQDLLAKYGLPPEKVHVVNWAPVVDAYPVPTQADLQAARAKFGLPEAFAFYPAATWRHKNHLALVEAIALLRDAGTRVDLVCSGARTEFFPAVERRMAALGLADQVRFVGFVTPIELQALYRLARVMVFPSQFEGAGMPVFEAFHAGVPVAASNATCMPSQVGDAGLLFDPDDPTAISQAIARIWEDPALGSALAARGRERVARFSWPRTARHYRALYRLASGARMSAEDSALLASAPVV